MDRNKVKRFITVFVIFGIIIVLSPYACTRPPETDLYAIITVLGIDKKENDTILSAQIIIPKYLGGIDQNLKIVSAKGENISKAVDNLSTILGKNVGIDTCGLVVMGDEFAKSDDVMKELDYFFRGNQLDHNTILVHFKGEAKELMDSSENISKDYSLSLEDIVMNREYSFMITDSTVEEFLREYHSTTGISIIGSLVLDEDEYGIKISSSNSGSQGGSSSGGESGGSSESGSGGSSQGEQQGKSKQKSLKNNEGSVVFQKGKLAKNLTKEETIAMNHFINYNKNYNFEIKNVTDELYQNANISLSIDSKKITFKPRFENDKPVLYVDFKMNVRIDKIENQTYNKNFLRTDENYFSETLKKKIEEKINDNLLIVKKVISEEKLDILKVYETFEKYQNKNLKKYLENGKTMENFFEELSFKLNPKITSKKL